MFVAARAGLLSSGLPKTELGLGLGLGLGLELGLGLGLAGVVQLGHRQAERGAHAADLAVTALAQHEAQRAAGR